MNEQRREQMENLCSAICHELHSHEVQHWKDAPGTPEERMKRALAHARELYSIIRNNLDARP